MRLRSYSTIAATRWLGSTGWTWARQAFSGANRLRTAYVTATFAGLGSPLLPLVRQIGPAWIEPAYAWLGSALWPVTGVACAIFAVTCAMVVRSSIIGAVLGSVGVVFGIIIPIAAPLVSWIIAVMVFSVVVEWLARWTWRRR